MGTRKGRVGYNRNNPNKVMYVLVGRSVGNLGHFGRVVSAGSFRPIFGVGLFGPESFRPNFNRG